MSGNFRVQHGAACSAPERHLPALQQLGRGQAARMQPLSVGVQHARVLRYPVVRERQRRVRAVLLVVPVPARPPHEALGVYGTGCTLYFADISAVPLKCIWYG